MLGDGASTVLDGQRVLPARAAAAGFTHRHGALEGAVRHILRR